jgi:calcium-dependent protein kinase
VDIFSTGVILFILVQGIFPFKEARVEEMFYSLLKGEKYSEYWDKVGGKSLSNEFKDLMQKMFSYDPSKRPTIEELKNHAWLTGGNQMSDVESKEVIYQAISWAKEEESHKRQKVRFDKKGPHRGCEDNDEHL